MLLQKSNIVELNVWKPEDEAVTSHLRTAGLSDDKLIAVNIAAAQGDIETELNFPISPCKMGGWQCDFSAISFLQLHTYRGNVVVKYWPVTGDQQTLPTDNYSVLDDGVKVYITFKGTLPALADRADAVSISFDAGFESVEKVDPVIKQAILKRLGSFYMNHEDEAQRYVTASSNLISKIRHRIA